MGRQKGRTEGMKEGRKVNEEEAGRKDTRNEGKRNR